MPSSWVSHHRAIATEEPKSCRCGRASATTPDQTVTEQANRPASPVWRRRDLTRLVAGCLAATGRGGRVAAQSRRNLSTLLSDPIELIGSWKDLYPDAAQRVVERMRESCLHDVRLLSDQQPRRIFLDDHATGNPAIWLHPDHADTAWIIVDIGARDWSKLSYQFGHELGHVLANSWRQDAKPAVPCQWLEEAMVEAFSLRGLARLADGWRRDPPFPNDNKFGDAIASYRQDIIADYAKLAGEQGSIRDFARWFADHRREIEAQALGPFAQAASLTILAEYERFPTCVEGLGALNRWPGRSGVPTTDYLRLWEASCHELGASPQLPIRLRALLGLS